MPKPSVFKFSAILDIIGGNPFVSVPEHILENLFEQAGKSKGPIQITGKINNKPYRQTLVKYAGQWRLYVNMEMLQDSPRRIGEKVNMSVAYDPADRSIEPHPALVKALAENKTAKNVFDSLSPSRQKEIIRYISYLKTETSIDKNIKRAIHFLTGQGRFVGRDKP